MNLVDDAMKLAINLKRLVPDLTNTDKDKFVGKFFPMTVNSLMDNVLLFSIFKLVLSRLDKASGRGG